MRSATNSERAAKQRGISLLETLVALTLGLAIVSVAFNLYTSNRSVFKQINGVARLQESARIAAALLSADIRQAGGSLCRNGLPTTNIVNSTEWWAQPDKGIEGFASSAADTRPDATSYGRKAGDSFTVWNSSAGPAQLVVSTKSRGTGYPNSMDWQLAMSDTTGFNNGDVIVICDYNRALIAQAFPDNSGATLRMVFKAAVASPTPGNCGAAFSASSTQVVALPSCASAPAAYTASSPSSITNDYTWDTGSLVGTLTTHHWYIGNKTNPSATSLNNLALRRLTIAYTRTAPGAVATPAVTSEEIVENVSDMQITYLVGNSGGYPSATVYVPASSVTDWTKVIALRILLTLSSTEPIAVAAGGATKAATYTIPINVAIRSRLPGKLASVPQ